MERRCELSSVLLLDDLEMLLDETIYGNTYCPKLLLKYDNIKEIMEWIYTAQKGLE